MEMEYDPVPIDYEAACQAALDRLSLEGVDLSKPTELAFYIYFPKRTIAELFVECLQDGGFRAEVRPPLERPKNDITHDRWGVVLRLNNRPERNFIDAVSARIEDLAAKCHGEFDGWEVAIAP